VGASPQTEICIFYHLCYNDEKQKEVMA